MSGHSKWANIKHKKAAVDAKRGKVFTTLIKEIAVAAKAGGGDPASNIRLRQIIDKAKAVNMPADNVARAIKRGTGELPGVSYEEIMYEGYGPHGIAILAEVLSDNKNRTAAELRRLFANHGGSLGEVGSVAWMFSRLGCIRCKGAQSEDQLIELLIDYNIEDIKKEDALFTITLDPKSLEAAKAALQTAGLAVESAELEYIAENLINLPTEQATKVVELLEDLDNHEDVQNVYANLA
jgi:YebC/PmpR family DNA-binding regulatory protein